MKITKTVLLSPDSFDKNIGINLKITKTVLLKSPSNRFSTPVCFEKGTSQP
jgi:hypothetical protein